MKTSALLLLAYLYAAFFAWGSPTADDAAPIPASAFTDTWSARAAANYLDAREAWWLQWPLSQRDHATACVSCHTALPYALSRPTLRGTLAEQTPSPTETAMLASVVKRVTMWSQVDPFYTDQQAGPHKTVESRGTESILNALVLSNYDASSGKLSPVGKTALDQMWAQQLKTGSDAGSWEWLQFHNAPWEGNESRYMGATLAALAVGLRPLITRRGLTFKTT